MEGELPTWLDNTFLATVLQGGENEKPKVNVVNFSSKPAVAVGNNTTSNVFCVHVEYRTEDSPGLKTISLIMKSHILTGFTVELLEDMGSSTKESRVYKELLPRVYEKCKIEFGAKSFYSPLKSVLIFQDLNEEGYVTCDRQKQLDFSHCKQVFIALGKYHAATVACHHENPELVESLGEEPVYRESGPVPDAVRNWVVPAVKYFVKVLNEMDDQQLIADFVSKKADNIWESLVNICKQKRNALNVLNHGDCLTNNLMFKQNESGEAIDVKLLDFQLGRYASPVIDLTYFLWTSGNEDVRENHQEELYNIYLQTLNKTLEELGCTERLSSDALQESLNSAVDFVLIVICYILPFVTVDPENAMDTSKMESTDFSSIGLNEKFFKVCSSKSYCVLIPGLLKHFQATFHIKSNKIYQTLL